MDNATIYNIALLADFMIWFRDVFSPQLHQAIGEPGEASMDGILEHYSSMSRTPSGLATLNECHGFPAMKTGYMWVTAETYYSTNCGSQVGFFEVKKVEGAENGVVEVDCLKKVGGMDTVVATWKFVKKTG